MFYFEKINNKTVMKSDFLKGLEHFFTTRESVIKTNEPDFENLVQKNKKMFCDLLNINPQNLINPTQTHSSNIEIAKIGKNDYPECDGLILTNDKQAVFLNFADCTPIILYDKENNIAAVSHAGWRGTADKITPKTVKFLIEKFGTKPENLIAAIGPAISKCCYNVGEDVCQKLLSTVSDTNGLCEEKNNEIFVDLKEINKRQLEETGIQKIDICPYCTVCDNDMFFSYRKENATTNRHSALVRLTNF